MKSNKRIASLFRKGSYFVYKPVLFRYATIPVMPNEQAIMKAAFVVPKRKFKKAVDRNLLKRRMTAAFRQNKSLLHRFLEEKKITIEVLFIYNHMEIVDYNQVEKAVIQFLTQIKNTDLS